MASILFWNPGFLLLLYLTAGSHVTTASILLKLHGLEDSMFDAKEYEAVKPGTDRKTMTAEKRQSATGTCTCTCETKPLNATTNWSAETTGESHRKPPSAQEMVASNLRTDTSGANRLNAVPAPEVSQTSKPKSDQEDETEENKLADLDLGDSTQRDWGHGSRFLWKRLPDRMCYREPCVSDTDCCLWYNICDRSAKVCVDCWYGSPCSSERDCCIRYPYCDGDSRSVESDAGREPYVVVGQCVDELN